MKHNAIHPIDDVQEEIYLDGHRIDTYQGSGYHNITEAIDTAYEASDRTNNPADDYVYRVTNLPTGTVARYRINAGDHVVILPEESAEPTTIQ